jgi:hypothetical protein
VADLSWIPDLVIIKDQKLREWLTSCPIENKSDWLMVASGEVLEDCLVGRAWPVVEGARRNS